MLTVEVISLNESIVLRARASELLILPHHVKELKLLKTAKDFSEYFLEKALLNRSARKLFFAWLRKDNALWKKVYKTIQEAEISVEEKKEEEPAKEKVQDKKTIVEEKPKKEKAAPKKEKKDVKEKKIPVKKVEKPKKEKAAPKKEKKDVKKKAAAPAKKKK